MSNNKLYSWSSLLILAVLFLALTMISNAVLRGGRLDLTDNNLYTLSDGSKNILASIEEPITLQLYFSAKASENLPQIRSYHQRVREMLQEFKSHAGSNLRLEFIDPAPFSEAEDQAAAYGLQAVPVNNGGDTLYFGLVGVNAIDGVQTIPFLQPDKEEFLEYDLAKMVYTLNQPEPLTVGLLSQLPLSGGFDPQRGSMTPGWAIYDQLTQLFDVQTIAAEANDLPDGLDLLMLVQPRDLSEDMLYAIDQFALDGGRVLAFVDPSAEKDTANQSSPMGGPALPGSSTLPELFQSWGVAFDAANVVGDALYALQVSLGQGQPPVRHLAILGLTEDAMSADDIITAELETVNLSSAGHFTRAENASTSMQPLLQSSDNSQLINVNRLQMLANPADLLNGFQASGTAYNFAVRVSGEADSAYPDQAAADEGQLSGNINAVLFGDTDLLDDRFWVQRQNFFGQTVLSPFANNGDLVINAVDNLIGNSDLISIRTRATSARPFTRVEQLRREAEQRLRDTEQRLQQQLQETEQRINELQSARPEDGSNLSVFSPEQQAEIDRFIDQRLEIRRDLRKVRRELDKEIEALGTSLKIINIGLVPLLVVLLLLVLSFRRSTATRDGSSAPPASGGENKQKKSPTSAAAAEVRS